MTAPLLYLGPAGLGLLLLSLSRADERTRALAVRAAAIAGASLGLWLAAAAGSGEGWRTTTLGQSGGVIAGVAAASAWLLVAILDRGTGRWEVGALVGVAASGLALFATNRWLVPGLLFWMCSSWALATLALGSRSGRWAWFVLAGSDVLLAAALFGLAEVTGEWRMPIATDDWEFYALIGAVALRSGLIPRFGIWSLVGAPEGAALPLLAGGSFAILAGLGARAEPWLGVAALTISLACSVLSISLRHISLSFTGVWPIALALGAALVSPPAVSAAAVAAILALTVLILWPLTPARAGVERGLVLAFAPATVGFGVIAQAAGAAFERSAESSTVVAAAPWTAAAALLPVALSAGVVIAIRVGRQTGGDDFEPGAVLATWAVLAVAIVVGVFGRGVLGSGEPLGPPGAVTVLYAVALFAGFVVTRLRNRTTARPVIAEDDGVFELARPEVSERIGRLLFLSAATISLVAAVLSVWTTVSGLRVGFL